MSSRPAGSARASSPMSRARSLFLWGVPSPLQCQECSMKTGDPADLPRAARLRPSNTTRHGMPRPATTDPASPTPGDSRPTPERPPSPAPAAKPSPSCTAVSRTSAWPRPATAGPSPPSPPHPAPHYDRRKTDGDRHAAAQRNLFGRLLGCLHHCLATGQHYDETVAFPTTAEVTPAIAA